MNTAIQQAPQRRITVIPANPQLTERDIRKKHLRVAPYCRVSTDSEEQLNSYNAQIAYYTEKIAATPEWTMVRLYADEGITGTSMKRRKEFLKMLRDCDRGKIDLIITKSVSRFGRNTLDGLDTVRKLKRKGIGVFFEKENTNTLYMDNEMILTFMMSQAQAESESLSGSVKWGHRKNFKDGKVYYHYASFLGYRKGPDGLPEIDPDEAAIVRRIFSRYLLGQSVRQICRDLMSDGVKTAQGSDDIQDGILDPASPDFEREYWFKRRTRQMFRVKGVSWWPEEVPSDAEYEEAVRNLERVNWRVDCILTHCAPTSIQQKLDRNYSPDRLTDFLQMVKRMCQFDYWFLGHYHRNCVVDDHFIVQWEQMVELQWE